MTCSPVARGRGRGELYLIRHGATAWSVARQHTGRTDVPLLPVGEQQAKALGSLLADRTFVAVWSSPLQRAFRTGELAGLADAQVDEDLVEWDYGGYEGYTAVDIAAQLGRPWSVWADGVVAGNTPGETLAEVASRADRVLVRATALLDTGDVALVAHGHLLRVLAACWLGLPPDQGALFALSAGSLSVLGFERDTRVIQLWNRTA